METAALHASGCKYPHELHRMNELLVKCDVRDKRCVKSNTSIVKQHKFSVIRSCTAGGCTQEEIGALNRLSGSMMI